MKYILLAWVLLNFMNLNAQVPVNMAVQPALTYTENFDAIHTWTNNFTAGYGANRFAAVAIGGTASIPDAQRITTSSSQFITYTMSSGGLYKDTLNGRLIMLITGTTNHTNAIAIDFFMDFSGINAGMLSFDWATVFNGAVSSNRTATLKIYASANGTNFTELTTAAVTVTNYQPGSGQVTNISLPTSFNNNPNARLRFYYYNSAGGSTGSRPAIALDNISVTASGTPCTTPTASATNLNFSNITATAMQGNFTAANPAPDQYMVIATINTGLNALPVDGFLYQLGDNVGDGIVIYQGNGTHFSATNLNPNTAYSFFVFSVNMFCNGIIRYKILNPLTGTQSTTAGPPCQTPSQQAANLIFQNVSTTTISGKFTASATATEYLVVKSTAANLGAQPIDGISYSLGSLLGNGEVIYKGGAASFTANGLNHSTLYYFHIYAFNDFACTGGPKYHTPALTGQQSTGILYPCNIPSSTPANLLLQPDYNTISGSFNPNSSTTDGFMVIMSNSNTLSSLPQNGTTYHIGNSFGGGTIISMGKNYGFVANPLNTTTTYYFYIIPYNDICTGGPLYKTNNILSSNATTTANPIRHYYGNLHSHSAYSDGNQDNTAKTPADDYAFADNALCMDFLGISEHNHFTSNNNPGMTVAEYHLGLAEANNYNNNHPHFLALYGMEWGTLSNGGHALVYGIDSLIGWEMLNGQANYDIYVAKNDFLSPQGLFAKVHSFSSQNAFVTLAHPGFSDYHNLAFNPYHAVADSAITGIALESGPAFSTHTNYNDPGSNMAMLPYYTQMLSKGYHVAPMIDHDNHNLSFGTTAVTRTVVIAPSLNKTDFLNAMKKRNFYATQDCDIKATLSVYGTPMGSILSHDYAPAINVYVENNSSPTTTAHIKIMYGLPGNNIQPTEIASEATNNLSYTDHSLANYATGYYYADIMMNGKRTITAPIWYTRTDAPVAIYETKSKTAYNVNLVNPAKENLELYIQSGTQETVQITILNALGIEMQTRRFLINLRHNHFTIPLNALSSGLYLVVIKFETETISKKFIIE